MRSMLLALLAPWALLGVPAAARADERTDKVDQIFRRWDSDKTPGCAVGVIRDGRLVYEKSYGLADMDHGIRIGPETTFHIASVSKQFTAFAILLLEKEGKLSLDDDIRKHLPELHDFGKVITIRHLLNHTSGLRDQWEILELAGWRNDDVITDDDIFTLVCRQRELNFEPGAAYMYSNTGYSLAARIVERASGRPFRAFTKERIFDPLGMTHTRFPESHRAVVAGRAQSYEPGANGDYEHCVLSFSNVGATSLLTTVADLALWDQNFYEPRVGDPALIARMHEVGKLNNGEPIHYALGLDVGTYRGLKTVEHEGADAGFRCTLLRFPTEKFSVIVLANYGDGNPHEQAERVADIFLENVLDPAPPEEKPEEKTGPRATEAVYTPSWDAIVGDYRLPNGGSARVTKEADRLMVQATGFSKVLLTGGSNREFLIPEQHIRLAFEEPVDGKSPGLVIKRGGKTMRGARFDRATPSEAQLAEYAGDFWSEELGVLYTVAVRDGALTIRHPRGLKTLRPVDADRFESEYPMARISFVRDRDGNVTHLRIANERVHHLQFERGSFVPSHAGRTSSPADKPE